MEDWALQGLSSFTKLQTQLATKAAAANMGMLMADLEADARGVKAYKAAVACEQKAKDRRVCIYKRHRCEEGCFQVKEFMKKRFSIVDIPGATHISREVGGMRRTSCQRRSLLRWRSHCECSGAPAWPRGNR